MVESISKSPACATNVTDKGTWPLGGLSEKYTFQIKSIIWVPNRVLFPLLQTLIKILAKRETGQWIRKGELNDLKPKYIIHINMHIL